MIYNGERGRQFNDPSMYWERTQVRLRFLTELIRGEKYSFFQTNILETGGLLTHRALQIDEGDASFIQQIIRISGYTRQRQYTAGREIMLSLITDSSEQSLPNAGHPASKIEIRSIGGIEPLKSSCIPLAADSMRRFSEHHTKFHFFGIRYDW